jgi:hypothetical protein
VTSDDGDVELARSNEGVEYLLAEGACGLFKMSEVVTWNKIIRRTPTWTIFLYAIMSFGEVDWWKKPWWSTWFFCWFYWVCTVYSL